MTEESALDSLREKMAKLIAKALREVRQGRTKAAMAKEARFRTAEYLLTEAEEYVNAAWDMLKAGSPRASLAASRWVLEAALDLRWAMWEPDKIEDRLRELRAEALRLRATRLEGLIEFYPDDANQLKKAATADRQRVEVMMGQRKWRLAPLSIRIDSLRDLLKAELLPNPYSLYRICCAAAHPGVELERRFGGAPGGATVTRKPPDHTAIALRILAASTLWLISDAYRLTGVGDTKRLTRWWKDEMTP